MNRATVSLKIGVMLLLAVGLMTGCRGTKGYGRRGGVDPLDGGFKPTAKDQRDALGRRSDFQDDEFLSANGDPNSDTSTASLAGRGSRTDQSGLRIDGPRDSESRSRSPDRWRDSEGGGATLGGPKPLKERPVARVVSRDSAPRFSGLAAQVRSYDEGKRELDRFGARPVRLNQLPSGDWEVRTAISLEGGKRKVFASAPQRDPLTAVRSVLDSVEQFDREMSNPDR